VCHKRYCLSFSYETFLGFVNQGNNSLITEFEMFSPLLVFEFVRMGINSPLDVWQNSQVRPLGP
jgi:hypothetical protein